MPELPNKIYRSTFLDGARWDRFDVRPDDIVVATCYKAGTTWMQNIVLHLIFQDLQPRDIGQVSPWIEMRYREFEPMRDRLEAQAHRRVIKSHMPFDGLLFYPELKYIYVARDPRDIFMSLWTFYRNFDDSFFEPIDVPGLPDLPRPPSDILTFWEGWIGQGFVEGETDGYPFWSCFHLMRTWWEARARGNVLFVHYNDMLADLRGEIARVASFLGIEVAPKMLDEITELSSFSAMRRDARVIDANSEENLKGGAQSFFHKGTVGRWADVLDDVRLARYHDVALARMGLACKAWSETGGPVPSVEATV